MEETSLARPGSAAPRQPASAPQPLAARMARAIAGLPASDLPPEAIAKARLCLYDFIGCAFEARDKPWSRQALAMAPPLPSSTPGAATIIGSPGAFTAGDAAFANAVMGHGLVREDMHAPSISHLGVVVLPTLLALCRQRRVTGAAFLAAVVAGYEAGAQIGRAVVDSDLARLRRPTGITGPIAAAAAGAYLLGLDAAQCTSAIALAANTTAGLNEWGHTGGSEMFFHPGFAARNGLTAVLLAQAGAFASPTALDGEAGLFASLQRAGAGASLALFGGAPEILGVYHKPVPACNFAQTACLAACAVAQRIRPEAHQITGIRIRVPQAAARYPGCDATGPFAHGLQAKMSIPYTVAAALLTGAVAEANFERLDDPRLQRLLACTVLEVDPQFTAAFPQRQGAQVEVQLADGSRHAQHLDDVVHATPDAVRARFRTAATDCLGAAAAARIEACLEGLASSPDAAQLPALLAREAA